MDFQTTLLSGSAAIGEESQLEKEEGGGAGDEGGDIGTSDMLIESAPVQCGASISCSASKFAAILSLDAMLLLVKK